MTLQELVKAEHMPDQEPDTCAVDSAYGAGLYLLAANFLIEAIEVSDELSTAYEKEYTPERLADELLTWRELPNYFCASCNAYVTCWDLKNGPTACHACGDPNEALVEILRQDLDEASDDDGA